MNQNRREVRFDKYCRICKHQKLDGWKDPCNECLDESTNVDSEKPVKYEENQKKK